jgi:protein-S-isoprenylcysteine O-methyltransferase Ste14
VVLYVVIRFGVIAQEEIYLENKFGARYLDYKARVRRWL